MAAEERWYFTKEKLADTPSRRCGIDADKELSYRQQAANFIQDMGQRLQVNQLCINTAIVYMHRFYMLHTFKKFHRNAISTCALFLAAKVEEQPRKLEHVIKVAHLCLHRDAPPLDTKSEGYQEQSQELVFNENIMLQTLGFDVAIDHPHTHVVKCCQLVRGGNTSLHQHHASKDLAQTSYFMATNSLHLTTMCLQYKPTVVACVCIHLACKWANLEIPMSSEGKKWFFYVDKTVSPELLEELTTEFLLILEKCPSRLKRKMMSATNSELLDGNMDLGKPGSSTISFTLTSTKVPSDKHHERERASTSKSSASSSDKNGVPTSGNSDRKERIKKEHINSNIGTFANPSHHSSALHPSHTDPNQQQLPSTLTSPVKQDVVKIPNSMDNAQLSLSSDSVMKKRVDNTPRTMTPKEYHEYKDRNKREKEKGKLHLQSSLTEQSRSSKHAGISSTAVPKPLASPNLDGIGSVTEDVNQGAVRSSRRTPEKEFKGSKAPSVNPLSDAAMTNFPLGPILTPSPPTTKDGDPFRIDEDMAVFTSPSDLLVPVTPVEPEPGIQQDVDIHKFGIPKSEHRKQRKEEIKLNTKPLSPTYLNTINEQMVVNSDHRKRERLNSSDIQSNILESDQTLQKHNLNSNEKPIKHHRVKKSTPIKSEHQGESDVFLPQVHNVLVSDQAHQNPSFSGAKIFETSSNVTSQGDSYLHPSSMLGDIQQPGPLTTPVIPEPVNESKLNVNFHEKHSSNQKGMLQASSLSQIPENINSGDKSIIDERDTSSLQPVTAEFESKHSKRSLQSSSSKHDKKEKRRKHDKKDKNREHKEKSEDKIPKIKLTIPKETKTESSDQSNHKPKDESLVVKIKLNTGAASGKSNKNGNLPEVVPSVPAVTEVLAIKERTGLKLKITKNPSSKESYTIGTDDSKKDKSKSGKEARKRSRSSTSPKNKDTPVSISDELVSEAKFSKTASGKSPKGVKGVINNVINNNQPPLTNSFPVSASHEQISNTASTRQATIGQVAQLNAFQPVMTNTNSNNSRRSSGHERNRGGKRGRGGGVRMSGPMQPGPALPLPIPQQQPMMYQGLNLPMGIYDGGGRASSGDNNYNQFYNFGQNNYYNHQMGHGFQDDKSMYFNQLAPPPLMRPPPHHMAFQPNAHQQTRRGNNHNFIRSSGPQRTGPNSGPPLPPVPPPANPPLPPDM